MQSELGNNHPFRLSGESAERFFESMKLLQGGMFMQWGIEMVDDNFSDNQARFSPDGEMAGQERFVFMLS